jgi:hypothetical protein
MSIRNAVAAVACAALAFTAQAQLRIVSMNGSNTGSGTAGPARWYADDPVGDRLVR